MYNLHELVVLNPHGETITTDRNLIDLVLNKCTFYDPKKQIPLDPNRIDSSTAILDHTHNMIFGRKGALLFFSGNTCLSHLENKDLIVELNQAYLSYQDRGVYIHLNEMRNVEDIDSNEEEVFFVPSLVGRIWQINDSDYMLPFYYWDKVIITKHFKEGRNEFHCEWPGFPERLRNIRSAGREVTDHIRIHALERKLQDIQKVAHINNMTIDKYKRLVFDYQQNDGKTCQLVCRSSRSTEEVVLNEKPIYKKIYKTYKTKDAVECNYILTLPHVGSKPYPTILVIHGGPWQASDIGNLLGLGHVLVSTGYATLEVNYRGSTCSVDLMASAKGQYGKMVCDIYDAVDHAIALGFVDKDYIGITGASNGGYIALCAAFLLNFNAADHLFTKFRSIMADVPIADLVQQCSDIRNRKGWNWLPHIYNMAPDMNATEYFITGNMPNSVKDHLKKASPQYLSRRAKAPLLLCHGVLDDRCDIEQSRKLSKRLKSPHVYLEKPNEGHDTNSEDTAYAYFLITKCMFDATMGYKFDHVKKHINSDFFQKCMQRADINFVHGREYIDGIYKMSQDWLNLNRTIYNALHFSNQDKDLGAGVQ